MFFLGLIRCFGVLDVFLGGFGGNKVFLDWKIGRLGPKKARCANCW